MSKKTSFSFTLITFHFKKYCVEVKIYISGHLLLFYLGGLSSLICFFNPVVYVLIVQPSFYFLRHFFHIFPVYSFIWFLELFSCVLFISLLWYGYSNEFNNFISVCSKSSEPLCKVCLSVLIFFMLSSLCGAVLFVCVS